MDKKNLELEKTMLFLLNQHLSKKGLIDEETKNAIEREIAKLSI